MSIINRYVRTGGILQLILFAYGISLVMIEWCHTMGLPTDFYLMLYRVLYWPIDWMVVNDCCPYWLAELLKWAATP